MISIYNIRKNTLGEDTLQVELRGLSGDTKPTRLSDGAIENGSVFIEIDTQDIYIYDGENGEWLNPNQEEAVEEEPVEENSKSEER